MQFSVIIRGGGRRRWPPAGWPWTGPGSGPASAQRRRWPTSVPAFQLLQGLAVVHPSPKVAPGEEAQLHRPAHAVQVPARASRTPSPFRVSSSWSSWGTPGPSIPGGSRAAGSTPASRQRRTTSGQAAPSSGAGRGRAGPGPAAPGVTCSRCGPTRSDRGPPWGSHTARRGGTPPPPLRQGRAGLTQLVQHLAAQGVEGGQGQGQAPPPPWTVTFSQEKGVPPVRESCPSTFSRVRGTFTAASGTGPSTGAIRPWASWTATWAGSPGGSWRTSGPAPSGSPRSHRWTGPGRTAPRACSSWRVPNISGPFGPESIPG